MTRLDYSIIACIAVILLYHDSFLPELNLYTVEPSPLLIIDFVERLWKIFVHDKEAVISTMEACRVGGAF